ncbi:hypothetical protein KEM55_002132 [Ascosphaera atra]|nr:hypothetical protein KEM55_002132 [Ascosphaera atra]
MGCVIDPCAKRFRVEGHETLGGESKGVQCFVDNKHDISLAETGDQSSEHNSTRHASHSSSSSNEPLRGKDTSLEQLGPLIEQAKAEKELSFHIDDDSDDDAKFGQLPRCTASEVATPPAAQPLDENASAPEWQKKFACMHRNGGKDKDSCPNSRTIEILQKMLDYYTETSDQWRILAYRKAIGALKREAKHITTKEEARAIPGVGSRIADKIEEIVCTDRLKRLEYMGLASHRLLAG